jgi:HK97 family phage prohead protease
MKLERRALTAPLEVQGEGRTVVGYAAIFNSETNIGGQFRERVSPGAFSNGVSGDVRALFGHDAKQVLGRTKSGTLRLSEDERGLRVEIDLPDTQTGRDLRESMARGDIDGMSFGFNVPRGGDSWDDNGAIPLRTLRNVNLLEVSVVAFPQYEDTEAGLRSLQEARSRVESEMKEHNREGFAKRTADTIREKTSEHKFRKIPGLKPEA